MKIRPALLLLLLSLIVLVTRPLRSRGQIWEAPPDSGSSLELPAEKARD